MPGAVSGPCCGTWSPGSPRALPVLWPVPKSHLPSQAASTATPCPLSPSGVPHQKRHPHPECCPGAWSSGRLVGATAVFLSCPSCSLPTGRQGAVPGQGWEPVGTGAGGPVHPLPAKGPVPRKPWRVSSRPSAQGARASGTVRCLASPPPGAPPPCGFLLVPPSCCPGTLVLGCEPHSAGPWVWEEGGVGRVGPPCAPRAGGALPEPVLGPAAGPLAAPAQAGHPRSVGVGHLGRSPRGTRGEHCRPGCHVAPTPR